MKAAIWAEIRRLHEIEKLSGRAIAGRLGCSRQLVKQALELNDPPSSMRKAKASKLDPYKPQIDAIIARYPGLSAVRVCEKISGSQNGQSAYTGSLSLLRESCLSRDPVQSW